MHAKEIADSLRIFLNKENKALLTSRIAFKIDKANFHSIESSDFSGKIAFIDGGNVEFLSGGCFSVSAINISYSIFQDNKRIESKKFQYFAVSKVNKSDINVELFGKEKRLIMLKNIDISKSADLARKILELEISKKILQNLDKDDFLVMDGSLESADENMPLNNLLSLSRDKQIPVCGLSKTSTLLTTSNNSFLSAINKISPEDIWYYYPIEENDNLDLFIIKLNKRSDFIFRFEVNKMDYDIAPILYALSENSKDPLFPGYPYGLVYVHANAKLESNEKELLKTLFLAKTGSDSAFLKPYINSMGAHDILDSIC